MSTPPFRTDMRAGFEIRYQDTAEAHSALQELLPDPDVALVRGVICKPGSRTHVALVTFGGKRYFLKRYNCRGWFYRFQNSVRRSRAVYTWQLAWSFLQRGVPVPEPLICLEERQCRLLGRSYILMAVAPGQGLRELWPALPKDRKDQLLMTLGVVFGRMHRQGCLHGDLKWDNILLSTEDGQLQPTLVDLDGGRQLWWPCKWLARKDLARFIKDLCKVEADPRWERHLVRSWETGWGALD